MQQPPRVPRWSTAGKRLIIQLLPKTNLEAVGESRAEIDVPATGEPTQVYFDVRPTDVGEASAWVVVRQGQIPLVTLKLTAARDGRRVERPRPRKRTSAEAQAADAAAARGAAPPARASASGSEEAASRTSTNSRRLHSASLIPTSRGRSPATCRVM